MANSSRNGRIISRVRGIPKGFVRTYGDVDPLAPRLVGRILSQTQPSLAERRPRRRHPSARRGTAKLLVAEAVPMRGKRVDLDEARPPREL